MKNRNTPAQKIQENKNRSVASAISLKNSTSKSTFQLADNRPEAIAQKQLQEVLKSSASTQQLELAQKKNNEDNRKVLKPISVNKPISQLVIPPKKVRKTHDRVMRSKGKLSHRRSYTTYSYLNKSGKRRQGPHSLSHITISAAMEVAKELNLDLSKIIGSKLILTPRQANHVIRVALQKENRLASTRKSRTLYLKKYSKLWYSAQHDSGKKQEKAIEKLIEMNPYGTQQWIEGVASSAHMAGKGERRHHSIQDLQKIFKLGKNTPIPNLISIDSSSGKLPKRGIEKRAKQFAQLAHGIDTLSDASDDSDSDSEVEL